MPKEHRVRQGECLSSIADKYGVLPETIANDSANAELKQDREDLNILKPGDILVIPDKQIKEESCATEQRHRFRRIAAQTILRLQLLDEDDSPRGNVNYTLDIEGRSYQGTTDGEGKLEHSIPASARQGVLLTEDDLIPLSLGNLDPIDTTSGVKQRLLNLGYDCGEVNEQVDSDTEMTLKEFQQKYDLEETGQIDQATREKLIEIHGS